MGQFKQYWQVYFILFFGLFILFAGVIWLDIYIENLFKSIYYDGAKF